MKNEGIIIAGQGQKEKVLLENGKYEIHFYIYKEIQEENHYDLYFIKSKKPKYKLLIKQKKEKLKIIETINSKENTKEEAIRNFNFNFKLPTYFPIQNKPNSNTITWQKFIMSDGTIDGIIQDEFFNQSDKSFFQFRIYKGMSDINTKGWSETIISEQKIYFIEEEYKPFLYADNGEFVYDEGKVITFIWKEGKLSYSCSFGVTKDLNLVEEMKKVYNSLELINEKHK